MRKHRPGHRTDDPIRTYVRPSTGHLSPRCRTGWFKVSSYPAAGGAIGSGLELHDHVFVAPLAAFGVGGDDAGDPLHVQAERLASELPLGAHASLCNLI